MLELINSDTLKRQKRKLLLSVHPDKVRNFLGAHDPIEEEKASAATRECIEDLTQIITVSTINTYKPTLIPNMRSNYMW
jgi:hypothetical protein